MLVLSRKSQESITIDGNVTVRIISIRGNTVRLGIEAPKEVSIMRSELADSPRPAQVYEFRFADGANHCAAAGRVVPAGASGDFCVSSGSAGEGR